VPVIRRPGPHTVLGDHEKRIRALERNKPLVDLMRPMFAIRKSGHQQEQGTISGFEGIDWAVYSTEVDAFGTTGEFWTNDPEVFAYNKLDADARHYVTHNRGGLFLISGWVRFPNVDGADSTVESYPRGVSIFHSGLKRMGSFTPPGSLGQAMWEHAANFRELWAPESEIPSTVIGPSPETVQDIGLFTAFAEEGDPNNMIGLAVALQRNTSQVISAGLFGIQLLDVMPTSFYDDWSDTSV
jgi:hypothetical protein